MSEELSDEALLAMFAKEESRHYAFNLIVRKHQRRLYSSVRRMVTDHDETQDVLQNIFIKAWQGLVNFRGDAQLFSWLYRIAHNESITHLNKMKRGLFTSDEAVTSRLTSTLDSSEHFNGDAIQKKLQQAVMRLPTKQRAVFNMKYFEEMKYEEMSRVTGTSVGALKASYHIATKKIEEWITRPDLLAGKQDQTKRM